MHAGTITNETFTAQPPSLLVPPRLEADELLDRGAGSLDDMRMNFADMWRINRYLGGLRAVTSHLYPRLQGHHDQQTVFDLGAGSADIAREIARWARQQSLDVAVWALDVSARHLTFAQDDDVMHSSLHLIQADALRLPLRPGGADYIISCLFLHHLAPEQVIALLARTYRSARRGIIMSDLVRGRLPLVAFKLGQPIFAHSFLTRHDGAVSIRRAYTAAELECLAHAAGLKNARIYRHVAWRMTLVADK